MFLSLLTSLLFYFATGYLAFFLGASVNSIFLCYVSTILIFSTLARFVQLIEHGDVFAEEATYKERNMLTRNLHKRGFLERVCHFYTHNDSYAHTIHHLNASKFNRILDKDNEKIHDSYVYISLKDFINVIFFSLFGKNNE
jgi:hypothetical protein